MRFGREGWILGILLIGFVVATVYFTQQSAKQESKRQPSTYNAADQGARAIFELFKKQGLPTERFERPLTELPAKAGLLVMVEPLERPLQDAEITALNNWNAAGGTVLFVTHLDLDDPTSNLQFEEATATYTAGVQGTPAITPKSPYGRDVNALQVSGNTTIDIEKPEKAHPLITAGGNNYAVTWQEKKGRVVLVSSALTMDNGNFRVDARDNPIFYLNVAQESVSASRPLVLFDEYHHGFGTRRSVDRSLWAAIGPGLRAAAWYLLIGFALAVYTLNRRFGAVKELPRGQNRSSTEYIASMAGLYKRSGAGLLALETILRAFERELASRLEAEMDSPPEQLAQLAQQRFGWDPADLVDLIRRSKALIEQPGPSDRAQEQEIAALSKRLHRYRTDLKSRNSG